MRMFLLLSVLLLFSVTTSPAQMMQENQSGSNKYLILETHSRSEAVFRSVVVTGWGQFYNKQVLKGTLLLCGQVILVSGYFYLSKNYNDKYNDYSNSIDPSATSRLFDAAESAKQQRNIVGYLAVGMWLTGVVDAYLFGWNRSERIVLVINQSNHQPNVSVRIEF